MRVIVNPDASCANEIRKKIKENDGYCPCRIKKTSDTKCMCKEFRTMIENGESGICHCGLYILQREE